MAGLLDFLNTEEGRLGLGLLAAGGPTSRPMGFGERIQSAFAGVDDYKQNQTRAKHQQLQYDQGLLSFDKAKRESLLEQQLADAAKSAYRSPEMARTANGLNMGPQLDGSALPHVQPGFDQSQFLSKAWGIDPMKAMELEQKLAKDNTPLTVAPGASLVDRRTMKPVFTAPKELDLPSAVREYQFAASQGYKGSFEQWSNTQNASKAPKVAVDLRDPTAVAKVGLDIQDRVRNAFKGDNVIASQYRAMQAAATDPSPQGDTALLYSFFKVLDPESTVREGEVQMVNANRSIPDRFKAYAQRLAGGGSLLPEERHDLLKQASRQVQGRMPRAAQDLKAYRENASKLSLDPDTYAPDPYAGLDFGDKKGRAAFDKMPAANSTNKGKTLRDTQSGKSFVSNGMSWVEQK